MKPPDFLPICKTCVVFKRLVGQQPTTCHIAVCWFLFLNLFLLVFPKYNSVQYSSQENSSQLLWQRWITTDSTCPFIPSNVEQWTSGYSLYQRSLLRLRHFQVERQKTYLWLIDNHFKQKGQIFKFQLLQCENVSLLVGQNKPTEDITMASEEIVNGIFSTIL